MYIYSCADTGKGLGGITPSQGMVTDFKWSSEEEAFILTLYDAKYVFTSKIIL